MGAQCLGPPKDKKSNENRTEVKKSDSTQIE